ncbi:MAG: hypothetical protein FVQ84_09180 [Planctomycetes bacterium]|nr:hypothetical protein [Planctomycetota bacterium]
MIKANKVDDNLPEKKLPLKHSLFIQHYTSLGEKTFQNGRLSAVASGFKEKSAHNQASRLLKMSNIQIEIQRIWAKLLAKIGLSSEYVILGIMHNEQKLRESEDFKGAEACTKDLGQTLALFSERMIVTGMEKHKEAEPVTEQEEKAIKAANTAYINEMSRGDSDKLRRDIVLAQNRN